MPKRRIALTAVLTTLLTTALTVLTPTTAPAASSYEYARNLDGRLEEFRVDSGVLMHRWEFNPGRRDFSQWQALGGTGRVAFGQIEVVANATWGNGRGRLEVFGVGTNGQMYHIWQSQPNCCWGAWHSLGGGFAGLPTAAMNEDGRLEVFAVGSATGAMYHAFQNAPGGSWSGWYNMGGVYRFIGAPSSPSLYIFADGRIEVREFATDGCLYFARQTAPNKAFGGWGRLEC